MDANALERSQFQTLKDLGLYDGPIGSDNDEEDGKYLCETQEGSDPEDNQPQSSPQRYHSSEYLCDTQDDGRYRSPRRSPVDNDRFNYQSLSDEEDGYTSPASHSSNKDGFRPRKTTMYDSDGSSDGSSSSLARMPIRSGIHRSQTYTSPNSSPSQLRRNQKATAATSHSMTNESDEEDMYGPGDPALNVQMIHTAIGLKPFPIGPSGLPINWSISALGFHSLVEIHAGNPEFNQIFSTISTAGITVEKIERIENKTLLDKFVLETEHMKKRRKCSDEDLNIVYLFHGTRADKEDIAEEGLDQRLARRGHFGKGIYFSDNPRKCMEYIMRKRKEGQFGCILMCRVLLGHAKVYADGKQDPQLLREPERDGNKARYDSVKGCVSDYAEYITYTNSRALPEYFITVETNSEKYKSNRIPSVRETKPRTPPKSPPNPKPKPMTASPKKTPPKVKPKPTIASTAAAAVSSPTNSNRMSPCSMQTITTEEQGTRGSDNAVTKSADVPVTWGSTEEEFENNIAKLRATLRENKKKKKASPKPDESR